MLEFPSSTVGFRSREESRTLRFGRSDQFFVLKVREEFNLLKVRDDEEDEGVGREGDNSISIAGRVVETSL